MCDKYILPTIKISPKKKLRNKVRKIGLQVQTEKPPKFKEMHVLTRQSHLENANSSFITPEFLKRTNHAYTSFNFTGQSQK